MNKIIQKNPLKSISLSQIQNRRIFFQMANLTVFFLIAMLTIFLNTSDAKCCQGKQVWFKSREKPCNHYDAVSDYFNPDNDPTVIENEKSCQMLMCDDGRSADDVTFCGKQTCNWFGCRCYGGCRNGSFIATFKQIHGDEVYNVIQE